MKQITKSLLKFAGVTAVLSVLFRYALSSLLANNQFSFIWLIAAVYGIAIFISGWEFGKQDKLSFPLYDIGFRFHLTTYIVCILVAEIWFLAGFHSVRENIISVHLTALFWGAGLILHYIFYLISRKNTYKGLMKSDIFE